MLEFNEERFEEIKNALYKEFDYIDIDVSELRSYSPSFFDGFNHCPEPEEWDEDEEEAMKAEIMAEDIRQKGLYALADIEKEEEPVYQEAILRWLDGFDY